MEINEKLDIFFQAAIDAANGQSEEMIKDQESVCEESLAEYRKIRQGERQARVRVLEEKVRKEVNRTVSEQLLELKREYQGRQQELRAELFARVEEKLSAFRRTQDYRALLVRKIEAAKAFADGSEMTVYIDADDAGLKQELEQKTGCALTVGKESFGGGIRAVMREKNILMDESFASRLLAEKEKYS